MFVSSEYSIQISISNPEGFWRQQFCERLITCFFFNGQPIVEEVDKALGLSLSW